MRNRPLNIGHRGHELGPENTLESFWQAIDCGADMLEMDVWMTADRVLVVFHDEFLMIDDRTRARVAQFTARQLTEFKLPGGGKIPTLDEVFTEILPKVPLNLDLKFFDLNYRPMLGAVLEKLQQFKAQRRVLLSSFFHQSLEIVNRLEPAVATAPIFGLPTGPPHPHDLEKLVCLDGWETETGFERPVAVVDYLMLTDDVVRDFKKSDVSIVAYTVDEADDMRRMAGLGVAGIITKRPALLRQVLDLFED